MLSRRGMADPDIWWHLRNAGYLPAAVRNYLALLGWGTDDDTTLMPTAELSIIFVIFLGAYFTIVINTINGVYNVDKSMQRAALSLGAKRRDVFWKVVFPGTLPSIITGATVGMGITWMVLVAAEMIAGRSGIGFLTWESYTTGDIPQVVVGMASMGVGGAICSAIGKRAVYLFGATSNAGMSSGLVSQRCRSRPVAASSVSAVARAA